VQCQGWVDGAAPETFRLVEGWARWRHRNTVAFIKDLDHYLCTPCHDELAAKSFHQPQPRLFHIGSDGALEPPAQSWCMDCACPVECVSEETYILLRGWHSPGKRVTNVKRKSSLQTNSLAYVTVMGRYLCRECFKRKKAGIPVGQMTLFGDA